MAKIKWEVNPEVIDESGHYDSTGATLHVAMRQAQALADIATALDQIATELRYMRMVMRIREPEEATRRDGEEPEATL